MSRLYLLVDCAYISVESHDGSFSMHMPPVRGPTIASLMEQLTHQGWKCDGPFEIDGPRRVLR